MSNITKLTVPPNGAARMYRAHDVPEFGWCVAISASPEDACPGAMLRPSSFSALLTHDEGLTWPDSRGEALAAATLERGGTVTLAFVALADAMAFKMRLEGGAR